MADGYRENDMLRWSFSNKDDDRIIEQSLIELDTLQNHHPSRRRKGW